MNKKLLTLLLLATPVLLHAQATLDLASRAQLRRSRLALLSPETKDFSQVEIKDGVARLKKSMGVPAKHVFAVAKLKEGYTENDLKAKGVNDDQLAQYPSAQVGAGKFDAYAGLKEVIKRLSSGIDEVTMNKGQLLLTPTGNRSFKVCLTGCNNLNISMFNLSGQEVMRTNVNGEETIIHAEALPKGCYIVQVNGKRSKCVLK